MCRRLKKGCDYLLDLLSQLINNPQFADLLTGEDDTALQYLKNVMVEEYEDPNSGYKISFVSVG